MSNPAMNLYPRKRFSRRLSEDVHKHWMLYLMFLPVLAYYIIFCYVPMYGAQIAFRNFIPAKGITGSAFVGMKHFTSFFSSVYFGRLLRNTLLISLLSLIFGFPAPIIFALLLNELRGRKYKKLVQTCTYMPHFLSLVVVCGMIVDFTNRDGLIGQLVKILGGTPESYLLYPQYFRPVYIISGIWQEMGWGSIIYLAALTGIDPEYYDAASVDGAGRWRKMLHVTLPGIAPTITLLLILRCGQIMSVGYEKIILLYNDNTRETADVISTFVYRRGLLDFNYSYSTAVGLFNSLANIVMLCLANFISRRVSENSLW